LYGKNFINIVQMKSKTLSRYMIASFILARGQPNSKYQVSANALEEIALPSALLNIQEGSQDAFSSFLQALFEDYDIERAMSLVEDIAAQANDDFLLKNYVFDIKKQAYLLIFQTKCKLFRVVEVNEISKSIGAAIPIEQAI